MNTHSLVVLGIMTTGSFVMDPKFTIQSQLDLPVSPQTLTTLKKIGYESLGGEWISHNDIWVRKPIPWIVRPIENDLTAQEITRYRVRKVITVGDKTLVAYYLRTKTLTGTTVPAMTTSIDNQFSAVTTDVTALTDTFDVGEGTAVAHTTDVIAITDAERAEITNGLTLLSLTRTHIRSYAYCSGIEQTVSRAGGAEYTDCVSAWTSQSMECNLSLADDLSHIPMMVLVV